nr:Echinoderm microtubule associated protein like 1 [Danio rerio]AAI64638.1 Eml1 protein [Danio rerio]
MEDGFSSYSSLYDTSSLLQFCNDDSASATSSMEVTDRIASLEQRVQMQEDEIQLLKSALADVVRRLNISEEQQAMLNKKGPTKARPMIAALPLRPTVNNGTVLPKKGGTLPSPSNCKKDNNSPATRSTVKRTSSSEHVGPNNRKDSGVDSKNNRTRAGSTGSNSSGKKTTETKQREPVFSAGMRRVTHCKVTVQIYLHRPSKRTRSAEPPKSSSAVPSQSTNNPSEVKILSDRAARLGYRKIPPFSLPLRKCTSQPVHSPLEMPTYRSPVKSPSQYFQICY